MMSPRLNARLQQSNSNAELAACTGYGTYSSGGLSSATQSALALSHGKLQCLGRRPPFPGEQDATLPVCPVTHSQGNWALCTAPPSTTGHKEWSMVGKKKFANHSGAAARALELLLPSLRVNLYPTPSTAGQHWTLGLHGALRAAVPTHCAAAHCTRAWSQELSPAWWPVTIISAPRIRGSEMSFRPA